MFFSCSFTPYLLLIIISLAYSQTRAAFEAYRPAPGSELLTELKSSMARCLPRQTAQIPCCVPFVFPCWLQLHLPSDALLCLQGKTSNVTFSSCGPKCPWEIGYYQNIFDRNFVPINAKCFSWHKSCHLLPCLLVNDHKWLSTLLEMGSSVSLLRRCSAERLSYSSAVTFRTGNWS